MGKRVVYICLRCNHITLGCFALARMTTHLYKELGMTTDEYRNMDYKEWDKIFDENIRGFNTKFYYSSALVSEKDLNEREINLLVSHAKNLGCSWVRDLEL